MSEFQFSPNGHSQSHALTLSTSFTLQTHFAAFVLALWSFGFIGVQL